MSPHENLGLNITDKYYIHLLCALFTYIISPFYSAHRLHVRRCFPRASGAFSLDWAPGRLLICVQNIKMYPCIHRQLLCIHSKLCSLFIKRYDASCKYCTRWPHFVSGNWQCLGSRGLIRNRMLAHLWTIFWFSTCSRYHKPNGTNTKQWIINDIPTLWSGHTLHVHAFNGPRRTNR